MDFRLILSSPETLEPLSLSLQVLFCTSLLQLFICVPLACWLSQRHGVFKNIVDAVVTMPLVFPPIATGFGLLLLLGRQGPLARVIGGGVIFSFPALVVAAFIAGLPLVVKPIQAALSSEEAKKLAEMAAVLGKSERTIFVAVLIPYVRSSIATGMLLAMGRGLGEVGITLMLGGNIIGRTNTLSLEIYNSVCNGEFERAMALSLLVGTLSVAMFTMMKIVSKQ